MPTNILTECLAKKMNMLREGSNTIPSINIIFEKNYTSIYQQLYGTNLFTFGQICFLYILDVAPNKHTFVYISKLQSRY